MSAYKSHMHSCQRLPAESQNNLIAVTLSPSHELQNTWMRISDADAPMAPTMGFPQEGVYVYYADRAVQIAAAFCGVGRCQRANVCSCPNWEGCLQPLFVNNNTTYFHDSNSQPCNDYASSWVDLNKICGSVYLLGMIILAKPRTLWGCHQFQKTIMVYDNIGDASHSALQDAEQLDHTSWLYKAWNEHLSSLKYQTPEATPSTSSSLPQAPTAFGSFDDEYDFIVTDDDISLVKVELQEDHDDYHDFDEFINAGFNYCKSSDQPFLEEIRHHGNREFIFGLDDIGQIDDDTDMSDFADFEDFDKYYVVPAITLEPMCSSPNDASKRENEQPSVSSTCGDSASSMEIINPSDMSDSSDIDESDDSDEAMDDEPHLRYHYCARKPCPLGCQDPKSKMPWRCATDRAAKMRR